MVGIRKWEHGTDIWKEWMRIDRWLVFESELTGVSAVGHRWSNFACRWDACRGLIVWVYPWAKRPKHSCPKLKKQTTLHDLYFLYCHAFLFQNFSQTTELSRSIPIPISSPSRTQHPTRPFFSRVHIISSNSHL